jgi:hypothetical protein
LQVSEPTYPESPLAICQVMKMSGKVIAANKTKNVPLFISVHLLYFALMPISL